MEGTWNCPKSCAWQGLNMKRHLLAVTAPTLKREQIVLALETSFLRHLYLIILLDSTRDSYGALK